MECFLGVAIFGLPVRPSQWRKSALGKKSIKYCVILVRYTLSPRVMSYKIIRLYGFFVGSYFVHMYLAEITLKIAYKGCLQSKNREKKMNQDREL